MEKTEGKIVSGSPTPKPDVSAAVVTAIQEKARLVVCEYAQHHDLAISYQREADKHREDARLLGKTSDALAVFAAEHNIELNLEYPKVQPPDFLSPGEGG